MQGRWLPPISGATMGVRNKAKMVISGTAEAPTLGILSPTGDGIDLRDCELHEPALQSAMGVLAAFVGTARLAPYDVAARRGELKHLLLTAAPTGELMARFVCRSEEPVARIRKHLPGLLSALPALHVVSVNLQPEPKAIIEGEREILLHGETLTMQVGSGATSLPLHLRPNSFFQTNTQIASALYAQADEWLHEASPASVWDLYCGVGGFALTAARHSQKVTGVEVAPDAIASARRSAAELGVEVDFVIGDATTWARQQVAAPELVILNPPRRGIGAELAGWLDASDTREVVYSSCNVTSLAADLAVLASFRPRAGRLLDMFPNSRQYEVILRLQRNR